ncbi:hypothetical protein [Anaeromyxobacter diazotrophicus]|uniref:Uncharacterized protein n=1 Tax=Anaeromyxobacter diazotrophicus TaxID=2590199 RepID=A0A7I9VGL4_9BACT|nr:hypothetical protein [Anaeromyxobacter diazotrophicus]GEJ55532.1 hypothetical protein AMYX_02730 [Anaeromyxobacter diazotrophicus]
MSEPIVVGQSAQEYFKELVSDSLAQRRLRVREATEFYLVNLLAERLHGGAARGAPDEPLALMLKRALEGDREARYRNLKQLGDTSLFVSGFFGDSLARSLVDVDYYIAMGERAYDALSGEPRGPSGAQLLFAELAERFPQLVDLLAEIAEQSELRSNRGVLRLYERFLATGSERLARQLRERGVALFAGPSRPRRDLKQ